MMTMETIKRHDTGPAVEDVQQRLAIVGLLDEDEVDGVFGERTASAVWAFCEHACLPVSDEVTDKVWSALVDASFQLGDRTLYLRMPHFHGQDVLELQVPSVRSDSRAVRPTVFLVLSPSWLFASSS